MEIKFTVKAYGWKELAMWYAPDLMPNSASRRLTRWVLVNKELYDRLMELGWSKGVHLLTPIQVTAIVEFLGEP